MTINAQGLILDALAADPGTPSDGELWFNDTSKKVRFRTNGITKAIGQLPFNGTVRTVDPTDPTADYATFAAAIAAASSGDTIMLGPGDYPCDGVTIPSGVSVCGFSSKGTSRTRLTRTVSAAGDAFVIAVSSGLVGLCDLEAFLTFTGASGNARALALLGGTTYAEHCVFRTTTSTSGGNGYGVHANGGSLYAYLCILESAGGFVTQAGYRVDSGNTTEAWVCEFLAGGTDSARFENGAAGAFLMACSLPYTLRVTAASQIVLAGGTRTETIVDTGSKVEVKQVRLDQYQEKTTPVIADKLLIADSAASNKEKMAQVGNLVVRNIYETGGPTALALASIPDGQYLRRSGSTIIGSSPSGSGDVTGPASSTDNAVVRFDSTSGKLIKNSTAILTDAGDLTIAGLTQTAQSARSGDISPASIGASQNDYNPTGLSTATVLRLTSSAAYSITGLAGGADGRLITVINIGSFVITLTDEDAASTAANRFTFGHPVPLYPGDAVSLWYDSTSSRWRPRVTIGCEGGFPQVGETVGTAQPLVPSVGVTLFARSKTNRRMLAQLGPSNVDCILQPSIFANKVGWFSVQGNSSTAISTFAFGSNTTGTATLRNVTTGGTFQVSLRRLGYVSSTTAGSSAGTRHGVLQFFTGDAAGRGGFYYVARFTIDSAVATQRWFVGLYGTAAVIGNVEPSSLVNILGFGCDAAQTNVRFFHNDGSGTATAIDLGASFPSKVGTAVYDIRLFCPPNSATVYYSIDNLSSGPFAEGNVNTNIPANTQLLAPQLWINNGATASAVALSVISQYIETDN